MNRKITILLAFVALIVVSSYVYLSTVPPSPQRQPLSPSENLPGEDKLAKSDKEDVEENINGYSLEEDLRINQTTEEEEENRISGLSQQQQAQLMKKIEPNKMNTVLHEYNTSLPKGINNKVQYFYYNISYDYFLITAENGADIRENPAADSTVVARVENLDKVSLLQRAEGKEFQGSNIWYRVACKKDNQTKEGYLHASTGTPRAFRFDKMLAAVNQLKQQLAQGELHFISNYKNQNGAPPKKGDAAIDEYGYRFITVLPHTCGQIPAANSGIYRTESWCEY